MDILNSTAKYVYNLSPLQEILIRKICRKHTIKSTLCSFVPSLRKLKGWKTLYQLSFSGNILAREIELLNELNNENLERIYL
jgi:hypothetical protein